MSDSNNNNINTGASGGAGSSSRRTDNTKFPTMDKIFGIRPPPRERTGDANNNTKGTKFPTMQDVFGPRREETEWRLESSEVRWVATLMRCGIVKRKCVISRTF
uniref:Uncharacterized protein n=1 Tax=Medicago truncatula TaxID=3880 RepID=A2Q4G2_MEDTR|nr:hypothetical protein MtrDRAFT_AC157473g30v2 [Medicago truncatula]